MKMFTRKDFLKISGLGAGAVGLMSLTGCGSSSSESTSSADTSTESSDESGSSESIEVTSVTLYPENANLTSGTVTGYMGECLAEYGVELEVWAYSDDKTNAILASGDLPDVMYISTDNLDTMIQGGLLLKLDDYLDDIPHLYDSEYMEGALNFIREYRSNDTGNVYVLPTSLGSNGTALRTVDSTDRNAVKVHWKFYEAIGKPEINSFDDLLDVMEEMLNYARETEPETTWYGTVLNTGSDTDYWTCSYLWYRMQGYSEVNLPYLIETDIVNGTYNSILEDNSVYYKGLKWYNQAYQRGLMDEDSITLDRATQKPKVDDGYTMVPSGYIPGWVSVYQPILIPGTNLYYNDSQPYGTPSVVIGVNANTENIEGSLALLNMLADPTAKLITTTGPEGELWYLDENGDAYLTDEGKEYILENGTGLGFTTSSGESVQLFNIACMNRPGAETIYGDGEGGYRAGSYELWSDYQQLQTEGNETFESWKEFCGYDSWMDWLEAENAYVSEGPLTYMESFLSTPDDTMQFTVSSIADKVIEYS